MPSDNPPPDRFVLAATVDRLIFGSETHFSADDARLVLGALPRRRVGWFQLGIKGKFSGGSTSGIAAGVGDVRIDDKDRSFEYATDADRQVRVGQWKLMWIGRRGAQYVEIEQVMADATDEGRGALIHYDLSGRPVGMDIRTVKSFSLFWSPVVIMIPGWKPWKLPE